jgi:(p)ppGpp synthase/HD superfamily hydrolase
MDLLSMAYSFVERAHKGQIRKFTGEPYVTHLQDTAQLLWETTDGAASNDEYIAALCHDVVEDTNITLQEVGRNFGGRTMDIVDELTSDKEQQNIVGKAVYLSNKINEITTEACTIKFCDRLSNVVGLKDKRVPLTFVNNYIKETHYILDHINRDLNDYQQELISRLTKMLIYLRLKRDL